MIYIGIDPGTHTGFAVWDDYKQEFVTLLTLPIHKAIDKVRDLSQEHRVKVIFEDARQRRWFGMEKGSTAKLQGAGSVKRDCSIWEDFLTDNDIPFQAVHPMKGGTKLTTERFKLITGWRGVTSEHSRDAAMLVFGK